MHDVVKWAEMHAQEARDSEAEQPDDDQESASECCSSCDHKFHSLLFLFQEWTASILSKQTDS